jgi:hypothetical protein
MTEQSGNSAIETVLQRVLGEFLEMPGLRLTCPQGQRLWGLDEHTCRELLEALVAAGFLRRCAHGMYARATDGPVDYPSPRPLKAELGVPPKRIGKAV